MKAIILKWKRTITTVGKEQGSEAGGNCSFEFAFINQWIPIIPDSDRTPQLDEKWQEDYSSGLDRRTES
jgi:hypothetical protein